MNLQAHLLKKLMETLQKLSSHVLMQTDLEENLNKICCNHIKKSVGSTKFRFSALGLLKFCSFITKNMLMKNAL